MSEVQAVKEVKEGQLVRCAMMGRSYAQFCPKCREAVNPPPDPLKESLERMYASALGVL